MDKQQLLSGRVSDLSRQCWNGDYLTHTNFLSASELADFFQMAGHQHSPGLSTFNGTPYVVYGGRSNFDRGIVFFLPSYITASQLISDEASGQGEIQLVLAEPVNSKYADPLTHRDYLGAMMNLGIERNLIGDILVDSETGRACIFCTGEGSRVIAGELVQVKHTTIKCRIIPPDQCDITESTRKITGTVASLRLDSILTTVWNMSRGKAQALIQGEKVTVNGRLITSSSFEPGENDRISVRGFGKFFFLGVEGSTRKGRLKVIISLFI